METLNLNKIRDNNNSNKKPKRVGRGPGSGYGKTAGRGHKGQKSRSGVAIKGFEGGQMPIYRRLPKRGFHSFNKKKFAILPVSSLQLFFDKGVIKAGDELDTPKILKLGMVNLKDKFGIKLLADKKINFALKLKVNACSASAKKAIEEAGGKVELIN